MGAKLIVVEGIDGVGKTTLAEYIAQTLGGIYYKTPPEPYATECWQLNRYDIPTCFAFFIESIRFAGQQITEHLGNGRSVVADRWIWTTLAYHFARDNGLYQESYSTWRSLLVDLPQSDLDILLTINSLPVWMERMRKKNPSLNNQDIVSKHEERERILQLYASLNPRFIQIDNGGLVKSTQARVDVLLATLSNGSVITREVQYA